MDPALGRQDASKPQPKEEQSGPAVEAEDIQQTKTESPDANNPDLKKGEGRGGVEDIQPIKAKGPDAENLDLEKGEGGDGPNSPPVTKDSQRAKTRDVVVLGFRNLQLRRIAQKQDDLLRLTNEIAEVSGEIPEDKKQEADEQLQSYSEALRNYETLSSRALPFIPPDTRLIGVMAEIPQPQALWWTTTRENPFMTYVPLLGEILRKRLNDSSSATTSSAVKRLSSQIPSPVLEKTVELAAGDGGYRELDQHLGDKRDAFFSRFFMAGFGGFSFYVPMLVMTLSPSTTKNLLTILIATFLFGFCLAVAATDSSGKDILAATAAYAGVLVVFAGSLPIPS